MSSLVVPGPAALKEHLNNEVAVTDYLAVSQDRIDRTNGDNVVTMRAAR
jgi:hypothetical protein